MGNKKPLKSAQKQPQSQPPAERRHGSFPNGDLAVKMLDKLGFTVKGTHILPENMPDNWESLYSFIKMPAPVGYLANEGGVQLSYSTSSVVKPYVDKLRTGLEELNDRVYTVFKGK